MSDRLLEQIPEAYREPLILFYRENQSTARVAQALELSEDAVRQRLSRGRKLLEERVTAFVEGALKQSTPGNSFTLSVIGALPAQMVSVGAASASVSAAKGGAGAKAAGLLAILNACAGLLTGFTATYLGYKMSMQGATSEKERGFIKRFYGVLAVFVVAPVVIVLLATAARPLAVSHPQLFARVLFGASIAWIPAIFLLLLWTRGKVRELNRADAPSKGYGTMSKPAPLYEYRSRTCLFGLPLVHIRFGSTWGRQLEVVKAWIAIGDSGAIGGIFAFGGMAIAPICVCSFGVGGVVFGGFGAGVLCYAGFGIGVWVVGGLVSGMLAVGGCAFGWKGALGGIAIANQFALGGVALAAHANDAAAEAFIKNNAFFQNAFLLVTRWLWPTLLLSLVPSLLIWRAMKKKRTQQL